MIKKSILKILIILIFVGLNWAGILSIGNTYAYFSDTENSDSNTYQTGTLDLSLRSGQGNFVPPAIANDMDPGESVARDIYIKKEGSLPFQYNAHSEPISGSCDLEFYELLELRVWYNWYDGIEKHMDLKYNGLLKDFDLITDSDLQVPNSHPYHSNVFYGPDEHWLYFSIAYPLEAPELTGQQCQFKFAFNGWQTNLSDSSFGFSDTEEIYSTLIDSIFIEEEPIIDNSNIVINEFLPIAGNYPEFIEFYNKGNVQLDIADWIIENKDTTIIINSGILYGSATNTIIEPGKWLVIDLSKVQEDILDNISDIIILYDNENNEIDMTSYVGASMVDKSYARIPDGSPNWVDPIPTPGAPNKLDEEEVEELEPELEPELLLEEIIEEIPLITATTTTSTIPDIDILENSTSTSTTIPEEIIPEQTTATTTEPLVAGAAISTTTPEPPVEELDLTTATTTESLIEETTTTTTTMPEEPITTTTTIPEIPTTTTTIPEETITITTTTEPPVEEDFITTTTTTTVPEITTTTTTTQPPVSTDAEIDDLTGINLINIYFV